MVSAVLESEILLEDRKLVFRKVKPGQLAFTDASIDSGLSFREDLRLAKYKRRRRRFLQTGERLSTVLVLDLPSSTVP